ncbi:MAG TPA: ATP-binding protein [Opitutus sp.]|nr:ATP-binding protein [Opitutus sp.]
MPTRPRISSLHACLLYLVAHAGLDAAARMFLTPPGICLWYPPVGLALALATIYGVRTLPVIYLANIYSALITSHFSITWVQLVVPVAVTLVYGGTGSYLRRRFGPVPTPLRPVETGVLVSLVLGAPVVVSILTSLVFLAAGGIAAGGGFPRFVFNWWIGDLTGVLTIFPLCLVHLAPRLVGLPPPRRPQWTGRAVLEVAGQALALIACTGLAHGLGFIQDYHARYLSFAPLVWICLRHGLPGATIATSALTMGSLVAAKFYGGTGNTIVDLVLFTIAVAAVGLGLGLVVTNRRVVERERERLFAILENTPDFIGTVDLEGRSLYKNAAFLKLCGHATAADAHGERLGDHHAPWSREKVLREGVPTALARGAWHGETLFIDPAGREVPVLQLLFTHRNEAGEPIMLSTVARDITDQKEAERARLEAERNLLQAQKLESLGVLAGGIAHDFNNLLTTMLGNATLARLDTPAGSDAERSIHQIELAALRAAELCRQMLAYSGKGKLTSALVDLNALVRDTTHLLHASISKKSTISFELAPALPSVHGDSTQLSQIIMNLVMNASDAIGDRAGHIGVHTGVMHVDRAYLASAYLAPTLDPGDYVFLEVCDDGCGMTPEVQARIFEPFFTTKFTGHGLGLSAVLGITRTHQGAIKVDSAPGRGTTFRLLLPAINQAAREDRAGIAPDASWRGSGRVLIADDEDGVRELAVRILERSGFVTQSVADGRAAVDAFRRQPGAFRLVLLDLAMPELDGAEALIAIQDINSAVPIILMSGYTERHSTSRVGHNRAAAFVQKPFTTSTLIAAVRTALEPAGGFAPHA